MKHPKKILSLLLVFILTLGVVPSFAFAGETPWAPYAAYITEKAPVEKRHLRATWVSSVVNLDWPSRASTLITDDGERIATQKAELVKIFDEAADLKLNAVMFQVRPTSDAFYQSELAPWSFFLTGKSDGNPGFDPLAFAIEQAHARNIELHAWFNPYRVSMSPSSYGLKTLDDVKKMLSAQPKSVYAKHPDWVRVAQSRLVLDPGIPGAREYVEDCIMEVVNNYDIDAVHFDDYFYTGTTGGSDGINDTDTYNKYNGGRFSNIKDWRRGNTQQLVENLSKKIKQVKPWVKFGISPSGVWRNKKDDPLGSDTAAGIPNYDHAYADTRKWVLDNTIDYICPQIYWSFGLPAAGFGTIAQWWADLLKDNPQSHTQLYIGEGLYRITESSTDPYWNTQNGEGYRELERQLKYNLAHPEISGSVLFRHANVRQESALPVINTIKNDIWANIALVPAMPQLGGIAPAAPALLSVTQTENGNELLINDTEQNKSELAATKYYAVYRVASVAQMNTGDARNLIALVRRTGDLQKYVDKTGTGNHKYAITALNRLHDESAPAMLDSEF